MAISSAASLRRHNSITTTTFQEGPQDQNTQTVSSSSLLNLKLVSLNSRLSSYTSLRDVLPSTNAAAAAAINSPTASSSSGYEISIRNHLVKQAAWAYLQPMSPSPTTTTSSAPHFLRHLRHRFTAFLTFINHHLLPAFARVFHRILHALGAQLSP